MEVAESDVLKDVRNTTKFEIRTWNKNEYYRINQKQYCLIINP